VKKSQAIMLAACWRRKARQLGPERRGAGVSPAASSSRRTVLGETRVPKLQQLTRNPRVAPAWILARKPHDELSHPILDRRTARTPPGPRPLPTHEFPMPAQQRLGRHDQPTSAPTREQSGQRREEGTIGCFQRGARLLASEHHELMS
jgi:hypothetical protein